MGEGETDRFQAQASELQISDTVEFLAAPSRQFLAARLRQADILVVPSRHEYPETNTALLEDGLSASIPMVTSDHPRFRDRVVNGVNAMIFPASNARALAHQIGRLVTQPHLYARLATAGQTRHTPRLTTWADLISNWLHIGAQDAAESHQRLVNQSMASGRYPAGTPLPTPISLGVTP
jgi:glycosyltransferase involved in cell wall biosynthesis